MMIEVTRTANAARLRREVHVDSAELPIAQRERITGLVGRLDLERLHASSPFLGQEDDRFRYQIVFTDEDLVREVVVDESRLCGELQELLELLLDG